MSDDKKIPSSTLSAPQGTANLDDVLASLEQQIPQTSAPAAASVTTPPAPVVESMPTAPVAAPISEVVPEIKMEEKPIEAAPVVSPVVTPASPAPSFGIEEKHIEAPVTPTLEAVAPAPSTSSDDLKDHPVVTPPASAPAPKKGLFGFSFDPKFAVAAIGVFLLAVGSVAAYLTIGIPFGAQDTRDQASACKIVYLQVGDKDSFQTTNCDNAGTISIFNGPSCPTTQTLVSRERIEGNGIFTPNPPSGQCQQVDHDFSGVGPDNQTHVGPGGVCECNNAPTPTPQARSCGEACTRQSDCLNPSTGGFPVECRNGLCQLPLTGAYACPEGQSSGSICSCAAKQQCGQPCGPTTGNKTCDPANSKCGFIKPYNACVQDAGNSTTTTQYCLPLVPNNGYTKLRCTAIAADSLVKPGGSQVGVTQADVLAACATPAPTPSPSPTPEPTPEPSSPPLACLNITSDNDNPVLGSQSRFTCGSVTGADRYEFRYQHTFNGVPVAGTLSATGNLSEPLTIDQPGSYKVQCRPCVGQACTPWEDL
jgi:hypothetical protein